MYETFDNRPIDRSAFPGSRRALQQATVVGATSVPAPSGTRTLYSFHGVGTQNYTARKLPLHDCTPLNSCYVAVCGLTEVQ
jgi:hypothetical protein